MKSFINKYMIKYLVSIAIIIFIVQPSYGAKLELKVGNHPYYKPGDTVVVDLFVSNLGSTWVNGCQALMGYSSYHFGVPQEVVPGGGVWEELIYVLFNGSANSLDAAIGVTLDQAVVGTNQDSTVAKIYFTAEQEGSTKVTFRNDVDTTNSTILSDIYANPVIPIKVESPFIYIDGTAPEIDITSIKQNGIEVEGGTIIVVNGILDFYITATDNLTGFDTNPEVKLTFSNASTAIASFVGISNNVYHYQCPITQYTPNGSTLVTAMVSDKSGNTSQSTSYIAIRVTVPVDGVTLNKYSLQLNRYEYETLIATISPSDATNKTITWTTSNPAVATVNSGGKVSAVGVGTCYITATASGGIAASCFVRVIPSVTGIVELDSYYATRQGIPLVITITDANNVTETHNTTLNATGRYYVYTTLKGVCKILAKCTHWLAQAKYSSIAVNGDADANFSLINGDCSLDNAVDESDYGMISYAWYTVLGDIGYDPASDLNGDNAVDESDFGIISYAWYQVGDE